MEIAYHQEKQGILLQSKLYPSNKPKAKQNKKKKQEKREPLQSNLFLTPTLPDEIQEIIKNLNDKKAIGPNRIPTELFKVFGKTISIPLPNLINLLFECGIFPVSLKVARVITPIHKNGDCLDCNNYHSVPLTYNLSKLVEKTVHKSLYNFLEKHIVIWTPIWFLEKHSTNHALIDINEKIRSALDQNIFAYDIFIDLLKAFDTVNHDTLLYKLDH